MSRCLSSCAHALTLSRAPALRVCPQNNVLGIGNGVVANMQSQLNAFRGASEAGVLQRLPYSQWQTINASLAAYRASTKRLFSPKQTGSIPPRE
jgi:hypothetical protein